MYLYLVVALVILVLVLQGQSTAMPISNEKVRPEECHEISDVMVLNSECQGYSPIGTLSNDDGKVLQLYGRPCRSHRDRWNYHTTVNDQQIPVELGFNGRRCENDNIGCDRVYSGDTMTARELGTGQPLRVHLYSE